MPGACSHAFRRLIPLPSRMSEDFFKDWFEFPVRPRVIVVGNHKGGSGKSTVAMHLTVALMGCGYSVGSVDLDGDQRTFSHFVENRRQYADATNALLAVPEHRLVEPASADSVAIAEEEEAARVADAFADLVDRDYIVVDTPGSDTFVSRLGHILADTLITPLNDSLVDLDVLVRIEQGGQAITGPSVYSIAVLERWGTRMVVGGRPLDWIVLRNRMTHTRSRNHRDMERLLRDLAPTLGYRLVTGLSERVVFRELFLRGLTVLDQPEPSRWRLANKSYGTARSELWALMDAFGLSETPGPVADPGDRPFAAASVSG